MSTKAGKSVFAPYPPYRRAAEPPHVRDLHARKDAVAEADRIMCASDAFAVRMRHLYGINRVTTYHRGLWGSCVVNEHSGPGLHIAVTARVSRANPEGPEVRYRIEVSGNDFLTKRDAERIVKLLMKSHLREFPPKKEKRHGRS